MSGLLTLESCIYNAEMRNSLDVRDYIETTGVHVYTQKDGTRQSR
jgi:hypothetical protein